MQATSDNTTAVPEVLLDKIATLINANLPTLVRECIDLEAERRYIETQIGAEFNQFATLLAEKKELEIASLRAEIAQVKLSREELYNQLEIAQATNVITEDTPHLVREELEQAAEMIASIKGQRQELLVSLEKEHQRRVELEQELEQLCSEQPTQQVEDTPEVEEENWMQYTLPDVPETKAPKAKKVVEIPIEEPRVVVDDSQMTLW